MFINLPILPDPGAATTVSLYVVLSYIHRPLRETTFFFWQQGYLENVEVKRVIWKKEQR